MPTDFYDVLGASADASSTELKRAYRAQVREYHPDVNDHPEGDAQFKLIREAHDVLSDAAERKDYDRMGHREYVDKRLDDLPSLSVFPDPESEGPADSTSETTVDSVGSENSSTADSDSVSSGRASKSSTSSSSRSSRSRSTSTSRSPGTSQSRSTHASGSGQSTDVGHSNQRNRSTGNGQSTGSSTSTRSGESTNSQRQSTGHSRESTAADPERSSTSWDDVTERTARSGSSRSSTTAEATRRRRGLRRWYGIVLLSLLAYLGGIGTYTAPYGEALSGLGTELTTTPTTALTTAFPLPSPSTYVLGTATAAASGEPGVGLLFLVGAVALPVVVLTAVAQFGHGSAWIYALASLGPVVPLAVEHVAALPTALALLGLVVLPLFSGLGFLVDVGRYLYATR
jgi:curved DNA-binding protein CbpA